MRSGILDGGDGGMDAAGGVGEAGHGGDSAGPQGGAAAGGAPGSGGVADARDTGAILPEAETASVDLGSPDTPEPAWDACRADADPAAADAPMVIDAGTDASFLDASLDAGPIDARISEPGPDFRTSSCAEVMDWSQSIRDDRVRGKGACSDLTVGDLLDQIRADYPAVADIERAPAIDGPCIEMAGCWIPTDIQVLPYGDGFRVVMIRFSGFSQFKHHHEDSWYFETNTACQAEWVGWASYDIAGSLGCQGSPLWGYPTYDCEYAATGPRMVSLACSSDGGAQDSALDMNDPG